MLIALLKGLASESLLLATPLQTAFTARPDGQLVAPYDGAALT